MAATLPICMVCKHLVRTKPGLTCAAFPSGIPAPILRTQIDHRYPYDDDQGITYEPAYEGAEIVAENILRDAGLLPDEDDGS